MSADGSTTWAFGDGDYGKLGLGNTSAKSTPVKIEALSGLKVKKVACGTQFSVALTRDGFVLTWGQDRLIGQTEAQMRGHCTPQKVTTLAGHFIEEVVVGSEHTLALTSDGNVWGWGLNADGQLGLGHTGTVREPQLLGGLGSSEPIKQISAGRTHSAAWSGAKAASVRSGTAAAASAASLQLGTPACVPAQYAALKECSVVACRERLRVLHQFSDIIYSSWRLLNLSPLSDQVSPPPPPFPLPLNAAARQTHDSWLDCRREAIVQGRLRPLLAPRVYTLPLVRAIGRTMVQGRNYGPQITVKRLATRSVCTCLIIPCNSLFYLLQRQEVQTSVCANLSPGGATEGGRPASPSQSLESEVDWRRSG